MRKQVGDLSRALVPSLVVICTGVGSARAQEQEPPFDPAIDVQLFDLSPGPKSFMSVGSASLSQERQFSLDLLLTFLTDPFVIYNVDENQDEIIDTRTDVVSSVFAGQLVGAYGLTPDLQLGVSLPLVFSLSGDGLNPNTGDMATGGLQATGFGDMRVEAKGRLLSRENMAAAWTGGFTVPTSFGAGSNNFLGDDLPALRGGLAAHWDTAQGRFRVGANVGAVLRKPRKIYASEVGQQLTYGVGAAFKVTDDFSVIGETFGRSGLTAIDLDASPLEVGGGVRAQATKSFSVLAGGGVGVLSGIGSPGLRFVVSVGYAPDLGDTDKDGVSNMKDRCPLLAEDMDQFEDSDGCPEDDNDGDRREDAVDKCPNDKEDLDGFEDEDGCPENDNDGDKILDADDRCPLDAEDGKKPNDTDGCPAEKRDSDDDGVSDLTDECPDDYEDEDGFEDWDGCPDPDNDKDGIEDSDDACPVCPEDSDGFEDQNGCPDLDNDHDQIPDQQDQCPDEPELVNGNDDEDGCPDRGPAVATLDENVLRLAVEIRFNSSDELRNQRELAQVARVMSMQADVTRWRIVVAARSQRTEELTRAKSQAQADAIKAGLVAAGMKESMLEAIGAVSDTQTIAFAVLERGEPESAEEFICPATLRAKERTRSTPAISAPQATASGSQAPAVAESTPAVAPRVVLSGSKIELSEKIMFEDANATILDESFSLLDEIAAVLVANPQIETVSIDGYTDAAGSSRRNIKLSQKRADAVLAYLTKAGVESTRMSAKGYGPDRPISDNNTAEGRESNRRVEFTIVTGAGKGG